MTTAAIPRQALGKFIASLQKEAAANPPRQRRQPWTCDCLNCRREGRPGPRNRHCLLDP